MRQKNGERGKSAHMDPQVKLHYPAWVERMVIHSKVW